jgi:hypothetical protein
LSKRFSDIESAWKFREPTVWAWESSPTRFIFWKSGYRYTRSWLITRPPGLSRDEAILDAKKGQGFVSDHARLSTQQ